MLLYEITLGLGLISLLIWIILLLFRGQFWRSDQRLSNVDISLNSPPPISVIIPARNEADLIPVTLKSLLQQDYFGLLQIILVDDGSTDGTAEVAQQTAQGEGKTAQLQVIPGQPLPPGWTGKLWALQQGTNYAQTLTPTPVYLLLTDADIVHDSRNLSRLVTKAQTEHLDLVSVMVKLRCKSFWEKLLIPAFIFFFEKLYPFRWVNNPHKSTAAAAGGCILLDNRVLQDVGGIAVVKDALIDDCALAAAVKLDESGKPMRKIWLGLGSDTQSLRPYDSLSAIWDMVARTAYTQLNYSPLLLLGTVIGMSLIYLVPPLLTLGGVVMGQGLLAAVGGVTWGIMSLAYLPTVRFYRLSFIWSGGLGAIALLYTIMTLDSARRHWSNQGGTWKGRIYSNLNKPSHYDQ
jgi:hopene-associated glycosyltransferase HpnB